MFYNKVQTSFFSNNLRLFLDLPYLHGFQHLKSAFTGYEAVQGVANKKLNIDPPSVTPLSWKARATHLVLGISECLPIIGIIVTFVCEYLFRKKHQDPCKLVQSPNSIAPHQHAWHLNLALLREAYERADGAQKEQIKFLGANFLSNVTPKQLDLFAHELRNCYPNYLGSQQGSPLEEYRYHREFLDQQLEFGKQFNKKLACPDNSLFILTDTTDFGIVPTVEFNLIDHDLPKERYSECIEKVLSEHLLTHGDKAFSTSLKMPFLIDVTHLLQQDIRTKGSQKAEKAFLEEFKTFKNQFEQSVIEAATRLAQKHPHLSHLQSNIKRLVNHNVACISRVEIDGVTGVKMLPIGSMSTKQDQFRSKFASFMIHTGLCIGAVSLRRLTFDVFKQRPGVYYAPDAKKSVARSKNTLYYQNTNQFLSTSLFQRLSCLFSRKEISVEGRYGSSVEHLRKNHETICQKPHLRVLGKATLDLVEGALQEIEAAGKWQAIHQDTITGPIFQMALFMIQNHLANAEKEALNNNFNRFAQEIELAHAHLATLLELSQPFNQTDFASIYERELIGKSVPVSLRNQTKAGLGKTAVNVFTGLVAASKTTHGSSEKVPVSPVEGVQSTGAYYEQAMLMQHDFDYFMSKDSNAKIELYHGQFNCNVDVGSKITEYKRRDIAQDVRSLLQSGRASPHLTVAVDITIDDFYSKNVHDLLSQFQDEIQSGKLNFAFFSSGQKFYTLGMDNYYGSYFYVVNNGSEKWQAFESLGSQACHQTDSLSLQWFCLATKYAADSMEAYRGLIFDNSRWVLDRIPASLQPGATADQTMRVNAVNPNMITCFIDIKALGSGDKQATTSGIIYHKFYEIMSQRNILSYTRGSFGFYHQNFAVFGHMNEQARTVRLNPGINPEENNSLVDFFNSLSATIQPSC